MSPWSGGPATHDLACEMPTETPSGVELKVGGGWGSGQYREFGRHCGCQTSHPAQLQSHFFQFSSLKWQYVFHNSPAPPKQKTKKSTGLLLSSGFWLRTVRTVAALAAHISHCGSHQHNLPAGGGKHDLLSSNQHDLLSSGWCSLLSSSQHNLLGGGQHNRTC